MNPRFKLTPLSLLIAGLAGSHMAVADHPVEEVEVIGAGHQNTVEINAGQIASPDSADLLQQIPGANANGNGPLSSIAQFRGMFGSRVHVSIDDMATTDGCPNAMDAPMSYAPAALVESISTHRGIAPVSAGQQAIGGVFDVKTYQGDFTDSSDWEAHGKLQATANSAAGGQALTASITASNNSHKVRITALDESGDDYEYPDGEVGSSEYDRQRYELGYGFQQNGHTATVDVIRNETGESGTPALPMDIRYIETDIVRLGYDVEADNSRFSLKLQDNDVEHVMTNFHLRQAPADMMRYRSTLATSTGQDMKANIEVGNDNALWRFGFDAHRSEHNADISNPNNAMFMVANFNEIDQRINGLFIETEQKLDSDTRFDFGMRLNRISMNAGEVSFSGMMGMMATHASTLRDAFNNSERKQTDSNLDVVIKLHQQLAPHWSLSTELGRKTRSATYQERYLWMPMESTGGLADGRTYIGNMELDAEASSELNVGFEWNDGTTRIAPRVFYRDVQDYIQGTTIEADPSDPVITAALALSTPLQFNNVDAEIYGMDIDWHSQLNASFALRGVISMVRGERKDIDDNLYRISPDHMSIALDHQWQQLQSSVEVVGYDKQTRISATNNEQETAGYALVSLTFNYQPVDDLSLGFGIDNLFDRSYAEHLGGINRANGSDVAAGERLPGMGRNVYAKVSWNF